jgi:ammonium transporter Rh
MSEHHENEHEHEDEHKQPPPCHRVYESIFIVSEIAVILLYCFLTDYGTGVGTMTVSDELSLDAQEIMQSYYPLWQDVHVMIYIGFGFLMVFLKTHCWTSVGFNYILSAWAFQCGILTEAFWHAVFANKWEIHKLDVTSLVIGDFCAAACMITFGALLGKADLF